ncbi:MAG TPA: LacI family DNA-binding transcriptional regulator [Sphaerochaeta sp.]|jgi:LacI family transcriptional regulator|nr:LacI family DNA-binding transcriptional regulator [Sphaerochaeta sp.]HPZ15552.1 LacI family DNA-binding transcriptional regulator [Sphaerochaeta sp.]
MSKRENPTIKDVAKLAGVSIATVSRVLNKLAVVNPDTEQKVLGAVAKLNYQPNAVARSLKLNRTKSIGIILPEVSNTFFTEIIEQLESLLAPKGYALLVCSSENSLEEERRKLSFLLERNVDGLFIVAVSDEGSHFADVDVPLVMFDRKIDGLVRDVIVSDNHKSAFDVTCKLIDEGRTRIGFLGGDPHVHTSVERYRGYKDALEARGLPLDERFVLHDGMTMKSGYTLMEKALSFEECPDAFFIVNDMVHIGATTFLMANAPKEVRWRMAFASFDYLHYAPLLQFCHYAVAQPIERMAKAAVQILTRRMEGDMNDFPSTTVFQPSIVVMKDSEGVASNGGPPPRFDKEFS